MSVARRMTVLRVTVPGQYFCTKHPDLNITAREIKNQAGTDCPCLRRNIHLCNLMRKPRSWSPEATLPSFPGRRRAAAAWLAHASWTRTTSWNHFRKCWLKERFQQVKCSSWQMFLKMRGSTLRHQKSPRPLLLSVRLLCISEHQERVGSRGFSKVVERWVRKPG